MRTELEIFVKNMDLIISLNTERKGEWRTYNLEYFKGKLTEEFAEVIEAFKKYKKSKNEKENEINRIAVMGELTDLANVCMMLFTLLYEGE